MPNSLSSKHEALARGVFAGQPGKDEGDVGDADGREQGGEGDKEGVHASGCGVQRVRRQMPAGIEDFEPDDTALVVEIHDQIVDTCSETSTLFCESRT
jgi:hypothetical protein